MAKATYKRKGLFGLTVPEGKECTTLIVGSMAAGKQARHWAAAENAQTESRVHTGDHTSLFETSSAPSMTYFL